MSCHALAITSWTSSGLAISVPGFFSRFVVACRLLQALIWGLLSFVIHSNCSDDPAFARFLEFVHFVLPSVPSVFLVHLVRQYDHLFVNFRQGLSSSHLAQFLLAPHFTHCWEFPSLFPQFPGFHPQLSVFDLLPHVTHRSELVYQVLPLPDLHVGFAHESWCRFLTYQLV